LLILYSNTYIFVFIIDIIRRYVVVHNIIIKYQINDYNVFKNSNKDI